MWRSVSEYGGLAAIARAAVTGAEAEIGVDVDVTRELNVLLPLEGHRRTQHGPRVPDPARTITILHRLITSLQLISRIYST